MLGIGSIGVAKGELTMAGLNGAAMQLFTHGTITGLLFLAAGLVYDKTHTRYIPDLGGLAGRMPVIATAILIAGLASLGLPGLSGFVSELLVFTGAFQAFAWPTVLAVLSIVLAAGYILWMMERTFFGVQRERFAEVTDASFVEAVPLAILVITIVGIGVYPSFLTDVFQSGLEPIAALLPGSG
jgi:NADH-quinone oxidoreductase subunit M